MNTRIGCIACRQSRLGSFTPSSSFELVKSLLIVEMMRVMMLLVLLAMMRWLFLSDSPFVTSDKKGSSFGYERVVILLGESWCRDRLVKGIVL